MERIEMADIVKVNLHNVQHTLISKGFVHYAPAGPNESWIIEDLENGTIHDISERVSISKKKDICPKCKSDDISIIFKKKCDCRKCETRWDEHC